MPFSSNHSKTVKQAVGLSCIKRALSKSCVHKTSSSLEGQLKRLSGAGYPNQVVLTLLKKCLKEAKIKKQERPKNNVPPVVIPYVHKFSHHLKKTATRYGVPIVFCSTGNLSSLIPAISADRVIGCGTKHRHAFVECNVGVVYEIPFSCGRTYVGQTEPCINKPPKGT